jgi:hypothetical protein
MQSENTVTGQGTAIDWGLVASNCEGIPMPHRHFLRSEVERMYPLLSDDLRARLGMDLPELVLRVDRILGIAQPQLEMCEQLGRH